MLAVFDIIGLAIDKRLVLYGDIFPLRRRSWCSRRTAVVFGRTGLRILYTMMHVQHERFTHQLKCLS